MSKANITTLEAARCLSLLEAAAEPIVAAKLAEKLRLAGSRESQRRHVRALVKYLRKNGSHIVATLTDGYWLTKEDDIWRDYLEGKAIDAKRILGETYKRKKIAGSKGQGLLFETRVCCGVATCGVS